MRHSLDGDIRRALPEEAGVLSDLAINSAPDRDWDAHFFETCPERLSVTASFIKDNPVFVIEKDDAVAGFCAIGGSPPEGELTHLILAPELIGHGYARGLWQHALRMAAEAGFESLLIQARAYSKPFYLAMGATVIGCRSCGVGRSHALSLLRVVLPTSARRKEDQ